MPDFLANHAETIVIPSILVEFAHTHREDERPCRVDMWAVNATI
jgi:hypothetical protein